MIRFIRRYRKPFVSFLVMLHLSQLIDLRRAYALTSGPSQPEVQGFQPAGNTEMVDLFTGDFGYNIPLFELPGPNGGYPFNLSYQAGIGMDAEASWVGLGWSLTPGAINRQMRGLPDEFKNESVYTKMSVDPSITVGAGAGVGLELFGKSGKLGIGVSVYRNNFRGIGYSIDASAGFGSATANGVSGNIGLGLKLDSQEGVGVSPQLGLGTKSGSIGLNADYNSQSGLNALSASFQTPEKVSASKIKTIVNEDGSRTSVKLEQTRSYSGRASLSVAHPGYTPQISMPMQNLNLAVSFSAGAGWWGAFPNFNIHGFYNEQRLMNDKKRVRSGAYGYLNMQHAQGGTDMRDFNREKEGMVSQETPNLAIPSMTYDMYSVTGQGISAMYRPVRNDVGMLYDPESESVSAGFSAGVDAGVPATYGINLSVDHARSKSGAWMDNNETKDIIGFQDKQMNDAYEPWYFKVHGEGSVAKAATLAQLGGDRAVRVKLAGSDLSPEARKGLEDGEGWADSLRDLRTRPAERGPRNQVIQPFTNEQILNGKTELMPLFQVWYDSAGTLSRFNRRSLPKHHTAGFTALTAEGLRYVYGIPAYNTAQEEVTFSAKKDPSDPLRAKVNGKSNGDPSFEHTGTDKFLKRVEIPEYAHSYLLTAIVGPDYVDVKNDGVTADDLGYWVKFTYKRTANKIDPYKWRDPYMKAHLQEGWKTDPGDDRGSYVYGEKELWYMVRAETKSHIAEFTLRDRPDGRGVSSKTQDSNAQLGKTVKGLKNITLYTRAGTKNNPIKVVRFEYDSSLCKSVYNSSPGAGKFTLKKLWFEYGGSKRGSLNPYIFDYHEGNGAENPAYSSYAYDRWGNYKPANASDPFYNIDFPYTPQDSARTVDIHRHAAVWSLKEIRLPSGGKVVVDYESDDYAYVQHRPAMQMTEVLDAAHESDGETLISDDDLKVRFHLEHAISGTLSAQEQEKIVLQYIDQVHKQVYFRINVNLRDPSNSKFEYVSGYADIHMEGAMGLEKVGTKYEYGYFTLRNEQGYHPFSMRAWQHVRTNQPELATKFNERLNPPSSTTERIDRIKALGGVVDQVRQMFGGFYHYCEKEGMGRQMKLGRSWVRLNTPDKKKYGGGLRVRQITMMDQWQHDQEGVYGQVYEYTVQEDDREISSGVAAYEPMIGGDENPLRYAKKYTQSIPLRSDNNLFFEYPINETYYPGPMVGYRKVTVSSLASASLAGKTVLHGLGVFPHGDNISFGTSGVTVHEFYTAKDFPVIVSETGKKSKSYNLSLSIPFLGAIGVNKLTTSQGYSVVTNDMHGKLFKVSSFRQDAKGQAESKAISWVEHRYAADTVYYEETKVAVLRNTLADNGDGTLRLPNSGEQLNAATACTLGEESDFILDMRQFENQSAGGGANFNVDFVYLLFGFIPVPTGWPNLSNSFTQLRTAATNKVIFRAGIQTSTQAYDGGSILTTRNLKWSKDTGALLLTEVNNNFNELIYNYTIPAFTQYEGMGQAYRNTGLTFEIDNVDNLPYHDSYYQFTTASSNVLMTGDELLLYERGSDATKPVARAVYAGQEQGDRLLYAPAPLTADSYEALIVRSGYRNQLSVAAGTVTALKDPSVGEATKPYTRTLTLPRP